jgi:hypothetical protein
VRLLAAPRQPPYKSLPRGEAGLHRFSHRRTDCD